MKINQALSVISKNIANIYSFNESISIAKIVVQHILKVNNLKLSLSINEQFPNEKLEKLFFILKRLEQGEPVQYIVGQTYFLEFPLIVNKSVLIPRPETQELVRLLIDNIKDQPCKNIRILDIATGSGCIAIAIKKYLPKVNVYACDISHQALDTAKINAINNNVDIYFFQADILAKEFYNLLPHKTVDIIISNPPYVLFSEKKFMHKNVLNYEPEIALFVKDNNPLLFYNAIANVAKKLLKGAGKLYLEINENFPKEIKNLLEYNGFKDIFIKKDMFGKDRIISSVKQ